MDSFTLSRVNFPLYACKMLTPHHLLVAGGGGAANTGITNGFEIFELYHNGTFCCARSITHYDTKGEAVMNFCCFPNGQGWELIVGQEEKSKLYHLKYKIVNPEKEGDVIAPRIGSPKPVRRRRKSECDAENENKDTKQEKYSDLPGENNNSVKSVGFQITEGKHTQTDFSKKEEPLQKVVCVNNTHSIVATAGIDGYIRLWKYPDLTKLKDIEPDLVKFKEIEAHSKEIDDMDFSPDGKHVVSLSKDGTSCVWETKSGKRHTQLLWENPTTVKYQYKRCRYCMMEGDTEKTFLFTLHNPLTGSKNSSYVQQWNNKYVASRRKAMRGCLSALAVSDDGRFIGVGSMDGSVEILIAFSLQSVQRYESSHHMFVTGLEFMGTSDEAERVTGCTDVSLVSISVDNQIQIHNIPKPVSIPIWLLLLMSVAVLVLTFWLAAYIGL